MFLDTIQILTIGCEPVVVLALNHKPDGWPLKYSIKSVSHAGADKRIVSAQVWDIIVLCGGLEEFSKIKPLANAPVIVLSEAELPFDEQNKILDAGAARVYSFELLAPCLFVLHRVINNVTREQIKDNRMFFMEGALLGEMRNMVNECSHCHRWRNPITGEYTSIEKFLQQFGIIISSGVCLDCFGELYGQLKEDKNDPTN